MTTKTAKSGAQRKPGTTPPRPTKVEQRPSPEKRRTMILFGLDENKRPRAGRFIVDENLGLLAKAAETMDLIICEVKSPKLSDVALKLPVGRLHAGGPGFVPYIRPDLYEKVVEAAGADAAAP